MADDDYYQILGVNKDCAQDEIKAAFRKLAIKNHPDKGGDKDKFQKIQKAYEVLSDPDKRNEYDNPQQDFFNSPFEEFFNMHNNMNMQRNNAQIKRKDVSYDCFITLRDIYFGIVKSIKISKKNICKNCQIDCNECNGTGFLIQSIQMGPFRQILKQACNKCSGIGKKNNHDECNKCDSKRYIITQRVEEIKIERGSKSNQRFVVKEWGEQAVKNNEISGDLIINIKTKNDDNFTRINDTLDLLYNVKINFVETIIGKELSIPFFTNNININVKGFGIINPNMEYVIYNKALVDNNGEIGNLKLRFEIIYPNKGLEDEHIAKLEQCFRDINLLS